MAIFIKIIFIQKLLLRRFSSSVAIFIKIIFIQKLLLRRFSSSVAIFSKIIFIQKLLLRRVCLLLLVWPFLLRSFLFRNFY